MKLTVEAVDFARGLANALAFIPAASRIREVFVEVDPSKGRLRVVGTDGYAAGVEAVPFTDYEGPAQGGYFVLNVGKIKGKETEGHGAAHLEQTARLVGKGPVVVTFTHSEVTITPQGDVTTSVEVANSPQVVDIYRNVLALVEYVEKRPAVIPGVLCVDPALFARFSKVKADKTARMADLLFGDDQLDRVLVKIGPAFTGVLMPIDREAHGENVGQDGLW